MLIKNRKTAVRAIAAGLSLWAAQAGAVPIAIPTLFNTGVNAAGTGVAADGAVDAHYTLVTPTPDPVNGPGPASYVVPSNAFPIPPWLANSSVSKWIDPRNPATGLINSVSAGDYDYRLVFNLTGFNISTASITGQWATDNQGIDILINGLSTGSVSNSFSTFSPFSITSGFLPTINRLDFIVRNAAGGSTGNPSGLRAEVQGTAELLPLAVIPEPAAVALLGLGLTGLVGLRYRRPSKKIINSRVSV